MDYKITFGPVVGDGYFKAFDIFINGYHVGDASLMNDYPWCVYCTTGLDLEDDSYLEFEHEFYRDAKSSQRDIKERLSELLKHKADTPTEGA